MALRARVRGAIREILIKLYGGARRALLRKTYSVVSISEFSKLSANAVGKTIRKAEVSEIYRPRFSGNLQSENLPTVLENKSPEVTVWKIENAKVIGNSDMIIAGRRIVHSDLFDPTKHYSTLELKGYLDYSKKSDRYGLMCSASSRSVDGAISLLGECPGNYAHWLCEVLPKILCYDEMPETHRLPILVDAWIHPIFFESLAVADVFRRPIITVDCAEVVEVGTLFHSSSTCFTPPEVKGSEHANVPLPITTAPHLFNRELLMEVRERLQGGVSPYLKIQRAEVRAQGKFEFVYLRRTAVSSGNERGIVNLWEIEEELMRLGFEFVDPGQMTFVSQVQLLENAKVVVGASGAALANMLFADPGVQVVCLSAELPYGDYYYFAQMMGCMGHKLHYILGPQIFSSARHWSNRDYYIDSSVFSEVVKKLVRDLI